MDSAVEQRADEINAQFIKLWENGKKDRESMEMCRRLVPIGARASSFTPLFERATATRAKGSLRDKHAN
jgi:hypothetical protein